MKKTLNILVLITLLIGITVPGADASYFGFENVVEDTAPTLGGHLDVNDKSIITDSGDDIAITVDGTGDFSVNVNDIHIDGATNNVGIGTPGVADQKLTVQGGLGIGSTGSYTVFQGGVQSTDLIYTLPDTNGTNGDVLAIQSVSTNEAVLHWLTDEAGMLSLLLDPNPPTLGGDLNVGAYAIISPSGLAVAIEPSSPGDFYVKSTGTGNSRYDLWVDTSSGYVGIGTTIAPTAELEVNGNVNTDTGFTGGNLTGIVSGTAGTATQLTSDPADCSTGGEYMGGITDAGVAEACLDAWTETENNAQKYFDATSPTLYGTTTIDTDGSITVPIISGGADAVGDAGTDLTFQATSNATGTGSIKFISGDDDSSYPDMIILSDGRVGIGATADSDLDNKMLMVKGTDSGSSDRSFSIIHFGATQMFTVKDSGAVGIGNLWPSGNFSVDYQISTLTDEVKPVARFSHIGGTPDDGLGVGIEFEQTTSKSPVINNVIATIDAVATDVTAGTEDGTLVFNTMKDGAAAVERMRIAGNGNVGIGETAAITTDPGARLHVLRTDGEQVRLSRDASNYLSVTMSQLGTATLDAVGSTSGFSFNDDVTLSEGVTVTATSDSSSSRVHTSYDDFIAATTAGYGFVEDPVQAKVSGVADSGEITLVKDPLNFTFTWVAGYALSDINSWNNIALGDLDNDGDLDAVEGCISGYLIYHRNDGDANGFNFVYDADANFPDISAEAYTAAELADIDADGDLDLFIGNNGGYVIYYRNDGSISEPSWTWVDDKYFGNHDAGSRVEPHLIDIDADGDLDALIMNHNSQIHFLRNDGTRTDPSWTNVSEDWIPEVSGVGVRVAFVDLDGDGDYDMAEGDSGDNMAFWENEGTPEVASWVSSPYTYMDIDGKGTYPTFAFAELDADDGTNVTDLLVGDWSSKTEHYSVTAAYHPTGTFISQSIRLPDTITADTLALTWTESTPDDSNIEIKLRSATTEAGLSGETWYGPTSTSDTYTDHTGGTSVHSSAHDGDDWIQYKINFSASSDLVSTPTFSDITFSFDYTSTLEIASSGKFSLGASDDELDEDILFQAGSLKVNEEGVITGARWNASAASIRPQYGGFHSCATSMNLGDLWIVGGWSTCAVVPIGTEGQTMVADGTDPTWSSVLHVNTSGDGNIGIGTTTPESAFHVEYIYGSGNYDWVQIYPGDSAQPPASDCSADFHLGRLYFDSREGEADEADTIGYVCMGAKGWFYYTMTDPA